MYDQFAKTTKTTAYIWLNRLNRHENASRFEGDTEGKKLMLKHAAYGLHMYCYCNVYGQKDP